MTAELPGPASRLVGGIPWLVLAALSGIAIGVLDLHATAVQGTLLLLLLTTFAVSMIGSAPAWLVGGAVALTFTATHVAFFLMGGERASTAFGTLIAFLPVLLAAGTGRLAHAVTERAAVAIPYGRDEAAGGLPWYARAAGSRVLLAAALLLPTLLGWPLVYATLVVRGQPIAWWVASIWQIVTLGEWILLTPAVTRMQRGPSTPTPRDLVTGGGMVVALAAAQALLLPLLTRMLFIPTGAAGFGREAVWAFACYLPLSAVVVGLLRVLAHASDAERHARGEAERTAAQQARLAGELQASRLAALRAQLRPHFLFNALNAAVVLARRGDASGAAEVLDALADLLRYVMRDADGPVPLADELAFAERYLAIERARFPDRLRASIEASDEERRVLVPALVLQPLVENAVRHGVGGRLGAGDVRLRAWREAGRLHLTVEDDGPGPPPTPSPGTEPAGVGLANTRARLRALYGTSASLTLDALPSGGAVAHLTIPARDPGPADTA